MPKNNCTTCGVEYGESKQTCALPQAYFHSTIVFEDELVLLQCHAC